MGSRRVAPQASYGAVFFIFVQMVLIPTDGWQRRSKRQVQVMVGSAGGRHEYSDATAGGAVRAVAKALREGFQRGWGSVNLAAIFTSVLRRGRHGSVRHRCRAGRLVAPVQQRALHFGRPR